MQSLLFEPRGPLGGLDFKVVESFPVSSDFLQDRGIAEQLGLEEGEHRFGNRVIKRIADSSNRGRDAEFTESVGVGNADVLGSCIRVARELLEGEVPSRPGGHVERIDDELLGHGPRRLPSDDASREDVGDEGDVDDSGPRGTVSEIGDPELVGPAGRELSLEQVRCAGRARVRVSGEALLCPAGTSDALTL